MNIGKMDTSLVIQTGSATENDFGEPTPAWTTFATVWVHTESKGGGEGPESKQEVGSTIIMATTHRIEGVTQKMRGYMNSLYWDIISIDYSNRAKMKMELKMKDNQ